MGWPVVRPSQSQKEKPVPDPLLTSKKPVEGRAHLTDDRSVEREDLLPPPPPPAPDFLTPRPNDSVVRMLGVRPVQP